MIALSTEELIRWVEFNASRWQTLLEANPEILALPCDIRETTNVAQLFQHIMAVQLRYAERLAGLAESRYDEIPYGSITEIFGVHRRALALLAELPAWSEQEWETQLEFTTRSAGSMRASRRVIFVHLLMHTIRHYAQLATLVRHHGVPVNWTMDYLMMGASPVEKA